MARTISTIKQQIIDAKNADANLNALTSTSQTAIWNLWVYIVAVAIYTQEVLWDTFRADLETLAAESIPGTIRWYFRQAFNFQYGDTLTWDGDRFSYAVPDTDKQIIKRVAVSDVSGQVRIKVAKESSGAPIKLASAELSAFQSYMAQVKFAGTNLSIISYDPDLLNVGLTMYYDPLLLATDGSLITDSAVFPVEVAINAYLAAIEFGGIFNVINMIDAVQVASGVADLELGTIEGKAAGAASYTAITHEYEAAAGYMTVNTFTITYTANV